MEFSKKCEVRESPEQKVSLMATCGSSLTPSHARSDHVINLITKQTSKAVRRMRGQHDGVNRVRFQLHFQILLPEF